jgi:hypothetical protein
VTSSGRVVVSNAAADFGYPPLRVEPERETLGAARRCVCQSVPTLLAEFTPLSGNANWGEDLRESRFAYRGNGTGGRFGAWAGDFVFQAGLGRQVQP